MYPSCFQTTVPHPNWPPSLLPGFSGKNSPAFHRYYEAATTTGRFWRRLVCSLAPPYLRPIPCFSLDVAGKSPLRRQGVCSTGSPSAFSGPIVPEDALGSPKFPANPSCIRPALRPRLGLHTRLLTAFRCCPRTLRRQRPQKSHYLRGSITRLLHSLFTLHAALLGDDAKLASGG